MVLWLYDFYRFIRIDTDSMLGALGEGSSWVITGVLVVSKIHKFPLLRRNTGALPAINVV